jgi:hypothetical protein
MEKQRMLEDLVLGLTESKSDEKAYNEALQKISSNLPDYSDLEYLRDIIPDIEEVQGLEYVIGIENFGEGDTFYCDILDVKYLGGTTEERKDDIEERIGVGINDDIAFNVCCFFGNDELERYVYNNVLAKLEEEKRADWLVNEYISTKDPSKKKVIKELNFSELLYLKADIQTFKSKMGALDQVQTSAINKGRGM